MYKFIHNGNVIDVVENITYLRFLKKSHRLVTTDSTTANCVQASNNKDVYALQGARLPVNIPYKSVIIKKIEKEEFDSLKSLLDKNTVVYGDSVELHEARERKILELSDLCSRTIQEGVTIKLSDGKFHTFELTVEDQLNIMALQQRLYRGDDEFLYHEKGKVCKFYDKDDIKTLIKATDHHIQYNTTYFNMMKHCIYSIYDIDKINNIHYGDDLLTPEYKTLLKSL